MNRRRFLGAAGIGVLTARRIARAQSSPRLRPFVDPLPIPRKLYPGNDPTVVRMAQFQQQLHRDLPPTTLWGYNGQFPGPWIEVRRNKPATISWQNNLPGTHIFQDAIDRTLHGGVPDAPDVRTVVHLHGIKVLPDSDGYPEAWFSNGFRQTGPFFQTRNYTYPNDQAATMLWYHDHALAITRLNVYAGLAGLYTIRDSDEDNLGLPSGDHEIPLVVQDRILAADGSLVYPIASGTTAPVPPVWIPEFFGDTVLVNGKVWPYLSVAPQMYRFRMLNASNARFYQMRLMQSNPAGRVVNRPGPKIYQIGSDGGLFPAPVKIDEIFIAPAERFDFVIDFSGQDGKSFVFTNDGPAPFPGGGEVVPQIVMQFRVDKKDGGSGAGRLPDRLIPFQYLDPKSAVRSRDLIMTELDDPNTGDPIIGQLDNLHWSDPVTEDPKAGSVEIWNLVNDTGDTHPKHVHLVQFQILNRQPFDTNVFDSTGKIKFTGPPEDPDPNERPAHKDMVKAPPGYVTRIIAKFDLPSTAKAERNRRYRYIWHCHIVEHEDNEMMRPFDVVG